MTAPPTQVVPSSWVYSSLLLACLSYWAYPLCGSPCPCAFWVCAPSCASAERLSSSCLHSDTCPVAFGLSYPEQEGEGHKYRPSLHKPCSCRVVPSKLHGILRSLCESGKASVLWHLYRTKFTSVLITIVIIHDWSLAWYAEKRDSHQCLNLVFRIGITIRSTCSVKTGFCLVKNWLSVPLTYKINLDCFYHLFWCYLFGLRAASRYMLDLVNRHGWKRSFSQQRLSRVLGILLPFKYCDSRHLGHHKCNICPDDCQQSVGG